MWLKDFQASLASDYHIRSYLLLWSKRKWPQVPILWWPLLCWVFLTNWILGIKRILTCSIHLFCWSYCQPFTSEGPASPRHLALHIYLQQRGLLINLETAFLFFCFCFCFCFGLFGAVLAAHGRSQARGRIPAIATGPRHSHSNTASELCHSSWQCQFPGPLNEARDWTHILRDTSWIHFHCATMGIPCFLFFF